jgi:mevalonate kinase
MANGLTMSYPKAQYKKTVIQLKFNAKILLFGEYTILHQSDALLIPFPKFSGSLDFIKKNKNVNPTGLQSNRLLGELYQSLIKKNSINEIDKILNINQFQRDIAAGLYFSSNIPMGYGVGSSGALTAAIYYKYAINSSNRSQPINNLRRSLSNIESIIHGNSSGIDPLVSYLNQGLYVSADGISPEETSYAPFHPFLIDTLKTRLTGDLVRLYQEKSSSPNFMAKIKLELVVANNRSIHFLRNGDFKNFFSSLKTLSLFQLAHFTEMIPTQYLALWEKGIATDRFYLKLCGAGGGGYILGFTPSIDAAKQLLDEYNATVVMV